MYIYFFHFSLKFFDINIIEYSQWRECTQLQVITPIHRHKFRWSYTAQVYSNKDTNKSTHAISLSTYKTKYIHDPCRKAMLNNRVLKTSVIVRSWDRYRAPHICVSLPDQIELSIFRTGITPASANAKVSNNFIKSIKLILLLSLILWRVCPNQQ